MLKILVTGHCGYIGAVLVPMLLSEGYYVTGLDSDLFRRCTYTGELQNIASINKDIRDVTEADLEGVNIIIHLAGLSNDPLGDFNPAITDQINHKATLKLAEKAKSVGVERFLFASSCSNYGASDDRFLNEAASFNPVTPYGLSKCAAEKGLNNLASTHFSPIYLRASTAYGLSPRLRFDLVVNNLTAWAVTTGKVLLKSDGAAWRPLVHVEDICRAYIAAIKSSKDNIHNQAFNVGLTTENYQIKDIANIVASIVPDCSIEYADDAASDQRCYRVDCQKIALQLPHFKPQWTVARGVTQLCEQLLSSKLTMEEFEGQRFQRIAHLKWLLETGKITSDFRHLDHTNNFA